MASRIEQYALIGDTQTPRSSETTAAIAAEIERRGLTLVGLFEDAGAGAKTLDRPAVGGARRT